MRLEAVSSELEALGLTDPQILALTIWGEARARGRFLPGAAAIGWVVLNRMRARKLTARQVCLQYRQFSCWHAGGGADNHAALMRAARAVARGQAPAGFGRLYWLASGLLDGHLEALGLADPTAGATHYYRPAAMVPPGRVPAWARGLQWTAEIDTHRFFAGVK